MNPNHLNRSYDNGLDSYLKETSPKGVKATGRDVCLKKRVQLPWFLPALLLDSLRLRIEGGLCNSYLK
jgi:hypothetical protein